jgi:hypothetical protein
VGPDGEETEVMVGDAAAATAAGRRRTITATKARAVRSRIAVDPLALDLRKGDLTRVAALTDAMIPPPAKRMTRQKTPVLPFAQDGLYRKRLRPQSTMAAAVLACFSLLIL